MMRLNRLEEAVVAAAETYAAAAAAAKLYSLTGLANKPEDDTDRTELQTTYSSRLVQNPNGRLFYDQLLSAAPHNICPICGHRDVSTLDHQLPKSTYPLLAITPDNLVPVCSVCNHTKGDSAPTTNITQTLHPYFDDADSARWLFAEVVPPAPAVIVFRAEPSVTFPALLRARIVYHFRQFRLAALYGPQAARELAGTRQLLRRLFCAGGQSAVEAHLRATSESWAAYSLNCWQHAMYDALAKDSWFLTEDVQLV